MSTIKETQKLKGTAKSKVLNKDSNLSDVGFKIEGGDFVLTNNSTGDQVGLKPLMDKIAKVEYAEGNQGTIPHADWIETAEALENGKYIEEYSRGLGKVFENPYDETRTESERLNDLYGRERVSAQSTITGSDVDRQVRESYNTRDLTKKLVSGGAQGVVDFASRVVNMLGKSIDESYAELTRSLIEVEVPKISYVVHIPTVEQITAWSEWSDVVDFAKTLRTIEEDILSQYNSNKLSAMGVVNVSTSLEQFNMWIDRDYKNLVVDKVSELANANSQKTSDVFAYLDKYAAIEFPQERNYNTSINYFKLSEIQYNEVKDRKLFIQEKGLVKHAPVVGQERRLKTLLNEQDDEIKHFLDESRAFFVSPFKKSIVGTTNTLTPVGIDQDFVSEHYKDVYLEEIALMNELEGKVK